MVDLPERHRKTKRKRIAVYASMDGPMLGRYPVGSVEEGDKEIYYAHVEGKQVPLAQYIRGSRLANKKGHIRGGSFYLASPSDASVFESH